MSQKHTSTKKISDIDNVRIGKIVALVRQSKHLTAEKLAVYIGCDRSTLSLYEGGSRPIPVNRIPRLAEALGIEPRVLDRNAA